uniref:Shroom family member 1 n=1 Tax=Astyanax mexicanus TaxID=7994 RepID=A0A3B1K126_ASTMX
MDSYSFHFERMSNLDVYPLSIPVSRLSPAKSTSSIDQYTHQHGKGDSAYSSFSGGSTAPDYPSPFLSDDFHPHSLHYADLKYVKDVYGPTILDSHSKSPVQEQLYHSMEAIAHQHQHHQNNNGCHLINDPPASSAPLTPPPPPARLDSFITSRNLETSRARQSPEGQLADISFLRTQTANPEAHGPRPDLVFGHRVSQHYQRDQLKQDLADKFPESETALSPLPLQTSQPEHSQQMKCSQSEIQKKRVNSAYGVSVTEQQHAASSWHTAQNTISGSIQHKGQFYFVTGVYKSPGSSIPQAQCVVESSCKEPHRQVEQQRSHNTVENMFKNAEVRKPSSPEGPNGKLFFQEENNISPPNEDTESASNHVFNNFCKTEKVPQNFDDLEDSQSFMNVDVGRQHTSNHPIFYCGPEKSFSTSDTSSNRTVPEKNQNLHATNDEPIPRLMKQPLADMPTDKISKETTPLLYHLTGASQASLMNKVKNDKNSRLASKDPDSGKDKRKAGKDSSCGDSPQGDASKEEKTQDFSYPCNTLDESFKKYYKEKLKDAQSKVLRETSFKRKDLQLSWPNRIEQWSNRRFSVSPSGPGSSGPSSQNVRVQPDNPIQHHLPRVQETDKESLKNTTQVEKETAQTQNIPQPQVPRIGSRRRLTAAQKKLSSSEPEKLHQLADRPIHATCRSLGSEMEVLLADGNVGEHGLAGEHGLVANRRKMFETRGRALSTSSITKSSLKHLQQKALVAYMERKTGHKVAEPQQPAPQVPSQRHSTAGRHSDWGSRPQSANAGSKKLLRPLSAGRILDSSSARSTQPVCAQSSIHSQQSSWKEGLPSPPLRASVENLLDEQEQPGSYRTSSNSTSHTFNQIHRHFEQTPAYDNDITRSAEGETPVYKRYGGSIPDQRQTRVMPPRGKSLEELGVSKAISPKALSKSSEQLTQLPDKQVLSDREKKSLWFLKHEHAQKKLKQDCALLVGSEKSPTQVSSGHQVPKESCSSTIFHTRARSCGSYPTFSALEFSGHANCVPNCDDKPTMMLYGDNCIGVTSPANSQRRNSENISSVSKMRGLPCGEFLKKPEESPADVNERNSDNFDQEVSLSLGVTTEASLWDMPPEVNDCNAGEDTEHTAPGHPQNTQPAPSDEMETVPNPYDLNTESSPAADRDQEKIGQELKGEPLEGENLEEDDPKGQVCWERVVQEVVLADQSLARFLYPVTNRKTALMLMEQLLSEDTLLMEEHYKKKQEQKMNSPDVATKSSEMTNAEKGNNTLPPEGDGISLTTQQQHRKGNKGGDITEKKKQLIACIKVQLESLEGLRSCLQGEERENAAQGDAMEALVRASCMPSELERYTQFIGDLERVINLLLVLSARLARVQNALSTVDENTDAEEKQSLDNRHHLLCKQREDAKDLKDNLDRRERMVSTFLAKQLTDAQLQEYKRFIQTKASLLIRQKDLDEKQRLREEQLEALQNSIPP